MIQLTERPKPFSLMLKNLLSNFGDNYDLDNPCSNRPAFWLRNHNVHRQSLIIGPAAFRKIGCLSSSLRLVLLVRPNLVVFFRLFIFN